MIVSTLTQQERPLETQQWPQLETHTGSSVQTHQMCFSPEWPENHKINDPDDQMQRKEVKMCKGCDTCGEEVTRNFRETKKYNANI